MEKVANALRFRFRLSSDQLTSNICIPIDELCIRLMVFEKSTQSVQNQFFVKKKKENADQNSRGDPEP
uniref:Uncharacterized protein n=1 Tax=Rhizophora mucronata TaxID=61149 RepID=A0A2P2K1W8_RHIMU